MRRIALLVVLAFALGACADPDPSSPTAEDLRDVDASPDHTITVDEAGFDPAELEIEAGDVVLLLNDGDGTHTFTADEQRFDTGPMSPGDDVTLVLTEPGDVPYADEENPDHEGLLTIVAPTDR